MSTSYDSVFAGVGIARRIEANFFFWESKEFARDIKLSLSKGILWNISKNYILHKFDSHLPLYSICRGYNH